MFTVSDREKRTIRFAAVAIAVYLTLFFGMRAWRHLEAKRSDYQQVLAEAHRLRRELQPYENRVLLFHKLRDTLRLDTAKLSKTSLVAEASAAIQNAAKSGGVQLGPIRESSARPSAKELASMQLEGVGPVPAILTLLYRLEALGYPLILDSLQLTPEPSKPGNIKMNLIIVILDFEQWKKEEAPRA